MAEQKKAPARTRKTAQAAAAQSAPRKKRRTAKAASANTAEVKSMAVKAEPNIPETKREAPAAKAVETARPAAMKAADVLIETVEAVKAAAVRAAQAAPAPAKPAAEAARTFAQAAPSARQAIAPAARIVEAGTEQAREVYARAQATTEQMRHAMSETAAASARGALEVNGKVLDALRAQSEAAFDLWRSTLTAGSFSDAVRAQTSGARQLYETSAAHWRDVTETATRWLGSSVKPLQSWTDRGR
jgi:hypothetical protein